MVPIALSATPTQSAGRPALHLNISARDLAFQLQAGLQTDMVYIFLVGRDDAALQAHVNGQTLALRLHPETYESTLRDGITFDQAISLKEEDDSIRVIVIDGNNDRLGSITLPASSFR